ncbi:hypothetical protein WA026_022208 [Henosepilachna vigintioctopunctata]|uniref:Tonsoku-like protein n=1 Tax=Henosepilachna vigintioctopunctata TaxID=420089 RepID=A0AAW1UG34_9CUCU
MEINKLLKKKQKAIKEKNESALCAACTDLADYYMKEEKFLDAINEYLILTKLYKKQKKIIDFATVNRGIGEAFMLLSNYEKAIEYQKIYLGVSREQENILEEQRALATLGHTYLTKYIGGKKDKQDLNLAFKFTLRSLEVCESLTDMKKYEVVDMTARLYNNLGVIQEYQGHHDKSMEFFNKAIVLCKANDVYESLHQAYNSLASLLERKGEYNNAIQNFNLAIDVAKKLRNNSPALCDCLVSKSNILLKLGDFHAAKKSLQKAYNLKLSTKLKEDVEKKLRLVVTLYRTEKELISKTCSDIELQKFYEKMGDAYSRLGCFDCAIEYYLKMLDLAKRTNINLASCYYSLAVTYRDDEQFDKAIEYFEKEYELCDFKKGLDTLCEIADTKESNTCLSSEIIAIYERAVNSCKKANNQKEEGRMLNRLINYLERSGNLEQIPNYQKLFNETGFVPSDSEDSPPEGNSEDDVSLNNLTDDSEDSECGSPSKKRRSKNFQVRRNLRGETQLHTACISGKINVVQHLLVQGHPLNIRDNGGWLPIHDACISGHFEIVKLLLDNGAAVNDRGGTHCNGITPLHDAAVNGHLDIIELLLNRGASVLAKTDEGETAYHYLKKTSQEMQFNEEEKNKCENLLKLMSVILDKAGQSREINCNIKNAAFVSVKGNQQSECGDQRRRVPKQSSIHLSNEHGCSGRNLSTSSSSDEDSDKVIVERKKIVLPKSQATNEYKMVMDNLRKKVVEVPSNNILDNASVKRPAFVMRDDTNDDDWLEDDLRGIKMLKKRKMNYTDGLINSSHTRFTSSVSKSDGHPLKRCDSLETVSSRSSASSLTSKSKSPSKQSKARNSWETLNADKIEITNHADDPYNCDEFLADSNSSGNAFSADDFVDLRGSMSKQQISLLDSDFVRWTTSSENHGQRGKTCQKRTLQPKITHFVNTTPTKTSQSVSNGSSFSPKKWTRTSPHKSLFIDDDPMLALDVNIEGRPFRVTTRMSLKNTLTVKWLSLEAARRYAKKEYIEPVLELMTASGAELVDDDPIGTLFITDSQVVEVHAKVLKWNLPLVRERYKEACSDMEISE